MSDYSLTREGTKLVITCGTGRIETSAVYGMAATLPKFLAVGIRKMGKNPADYFAVNGTVIRKTHQGIALQIIADATAEYENSPEGLRHQRESLLDSIRGYEDTAYRLRDRSWERGDEPGGVLPNRHDAYAESARVALRAFDTAHPEIKAAIEKEKREATERFLQTN
jgi:hypothetical protein